MKKTVTVLMFLLFSSFLWFCAEPGKTPFPAEMQQRIQLMPGTTGGIAYVNVSKMLNSDFLEIQSLPNWKDKLEDGKYREFQEKTGFDNQMDVDELYMVISPSDGNNKPSFLAAAYGKYDEHRIIEFVNEKSRTKKLTASEYRDYKIYRTKHDKMALCFIDDNVLLAGNEKLLKKWLDNFTDKKNNDVWLKKVDKVKYKSGAYFVINAREFVDEMISKIENRRNIKKIRPLRKIRDIALSADLNSGLRFDGMGSFSDAENAELFYDAVKGLLSGAKLTLSDDRDAVDIINKIDVEHDGDKVRVSFSISKDEMEKLAARRHKLAMR